MYALCDSKTFYTYDVEIYCGKQQIGPFFQSNKAMDIVKRLMAPILNSNRNLTTDNFYTSYELAHYLLDNGITTIGTMRSNRREIPTDFLANKSKIPGTSLFGFKMIAPWFRMSLRKKMCYSFIYHARR